MKPIGILYTRSRDRIERHADSIILISSTVPSGDVGSVGEVLIDNDVLSPETYINMVGELLVIMEQRGGENFVAQAIAHYAAVTGRLQHRGDGLSDLVSIKARLEELDLSEEPEGE